MRRLARLAAPAALLLAIGLAAAAAPAAAPAPAAATGPFSAESFTGLSLRGIGPAVTSGRVGDIAVDPRRSSTWYVAVASGGVWKTTNSGTSWTPLFDGEGSYSIGCVALDPKNPNVVWVGTGENNSQRSVGYGDGVYRSKDGGKSWENVGLKASEHVGRILVDPRDGDVVWVAAQGPLWSPGGDRGVYRTADGGKTWKQVLAISENTGASDLWFDPRNPDHVYATSYQRRRHVWGMVHGGPESAIWKTTDGGKSWTKLTKGIPKSDLGRIGLAVSPASPDTVYALVEASDPKERGTYRSLDAGASWERVGDYCPGGPQYYQELVPDPSDERRVYSMDVFMKVTEDGGKTWRNAGEKWKHVDNHALWIDPADPDHLLNGNDGGVYESRDRAKTWEFKANLPVTQFYRLALDEAKPFYNVYGGTQDNQTLGGPVRTATAHGITNADWFVTVGGDGFQPRVDPKDPNIVYSEYQYAGIVRFDRKTGEKVDIQPQAGPGEAPLRWNWDSPLVLSPFSHTRLYFAAQKVFRSEDRGNTWTPVSGDLTRQVDRNRLKIMGRVWGVDAVAKNTSTSFYGNIVSLAESPKKEGLLYVGTDDGLVQVTEDGGKGWRKVERFPGVPDSTYVSFLSPSPHDENVVWAAFDNHKQGDFRPYVLRSGDKGRSWTAASGDLPQRGTVNCVVEDPAKAGLLYAGTEFGLFFSPDAGRRWVQLKGGMPTVAVRDIAVHEREGDLVAATFGRGFYVLDDLAPLRAATEETLSREGLLFPVRRAWMFIPQEPLGLKGKGFLGESLYSAPNPPFGAVFTYWLKEEPKSRRKARQEAEKKVAGAGGDVFYPTWDALRSEDREEAPQVVLTVRDAEGKTVRRVSGPAKAGFNRAAWDLRFPPATPTSLKPHDDENPFQSAPEGPLAMPGTYSVTLEKRVDGVVTPLGEPQRFVAEILGAATLPEPDRRELLAFQQRTARLQRAVLGSVELVKETEKRLDLLEKAIVDTPAADAALLGRTRELRLKLKDVSTALTGDKVVAKHQEPVPPSVVDRVESVVAGHWSTTGAPTSTHRRSYEVAAAEFAPLLEKLRALVDVDLKELESRAEAFGAPWTSGRVPSWRPE